MQRSIALFMGTDITSFLLMVDTVRHLRRRGWDALVIFPGDSVNGSGKNQHLSDFGFVERGLLHQKILPKLDAGELPGGDYPSLQQLADSTGCTIEKVKSVNSPATLQLLDHHQVDVGVSLRCYQRFRANIIDRFQRRGGHLVNAHPGLLPQFRGVMTLFRSMQQRQPTFGWSIHRMNAEYDAGGVYVKSNCKIDYDRCMLENLIASRHGAFKALVELLEKFADGHVVQEVPQDESQSGYYSFATPSELAEFESTGGRLVDDERIAQLLANLFAPNDCNAPWQAFIAERIRESRSRHQHQ